jgi:hypothetical protein
MILNRVFREPQDGHDGSYTGRGQQNEDATEHWWLTWDERGTRELSNLPCCCDLVPEHAPGAP